MQKGMAKIRRSLPIRQTSLKLFFMKRKEWLIVFLPLVIVWYLDRISKTWAETLQGYHSIGVVHFSLHHNPGAMLGLFADLPPLLRVVTLSTSGAFLVVIYALFQYLLPIKSMILRSGMSVLLGGILGNVTDRIVYGQVTDFIILGMKDSYLSPAFNIADAVQWIGYFMVVYSIAKEGEKIWPEKNSRRKYWINRHFQLKYCYLLTGVGLSISLIAMVFSYTYFKVAMVEMVGPNAQVINKFLIPYIITFTLVCIGFCIGLFTVGKIISHKIAGPIYAFEKYMNDLVEAKEKNTSLRPFKLREHDEFHELEALAHSVKTKLAADVVENLISPVRTDLLKNEPEKKEPVPLNIDSLNIETAKNIQLKDDGKI